MWCLILKRYQFTDIPFSLPFLIQGPLFYSRSSSLSYTEETDYGFEKKKKKSYSENNRNKKRYSDTQDVFMLFFSFPIFLSLKKKSLCKKMGREFSLFIFFSYLSISEFFFPISQRESAEEKSVLRKEKRWRGNTFFFLFLIPYSLFNFPFSERNGRNEDLFFLIPFLPRSWIWG